MAIEVNYFFEALIQVFDESEKNDYEREICSFIREELLSYCDSCGNDSIQMEYDFCNARKRYMNLPYKILVILELLNLLKEEKKEDKQYLKNYQDKYFTDELREHKCFDTFMYCVRDKKKELQNQLKDLIEVITIDKED